MADRSSGVRLLLVDDEPEFREATVPALERRGFRVTEAATGEEAVASVRAESPDLVILDLKMPGMDGLEALRQMRDLAPDLPVIILTGHGGFDEALAGIRLSVVDFLQKPVDVEVLGTRIHRLLEGGRSVPLREATIRELMLPPERYSETLGDQTLAEVVQKLGLRLRGREAADDVRSALVRDATGRFLGILRISDILSAVLPEFLRDSPYSTPFTGMFLAQAKTVGRTPLRDLVGESSTVRVDAPLIEAVLQMVRKGRENLAVMEGEKLVGVLRAKEILLEMFAQTT